MKPCHSSVFLAIFTISALIQVGTTRDLRNVAEPKTPETCTSLKATGGDDTAAIQKALDSCAKGKAVALSSGVFYSGPLTIPSGVSLLVDSGVTLKAIPYPKLYDVGKNTCGTVDNFGTGCKPFISISEGKSSGIYGTGTIDGQGGETMIGNSINWWGLWNIAKPLGIYQNCPRLIDINNSEDITVYQVTLINSPAYHLMGNRTNGLTAWGVIVNTPHATWNTDGIVANGCQNVTIAYCYVVTETDNIAIWSRDASSKHISVYNNSLIGGRSLSISSANIYEVSDVTFSSMTLKNLFYGIRIFGDKAKGGLVSNINYDNICIINVINPINLDANYYNVAGNRTPQFRDINFNNVRVKTGGTFILNGDSDSYPIQVNMNDVHVPKSSLWSMNHANVIGAWADDDNNMQCGDYGN
uniref:Glycoside hydrolase family 28 n=1 Tax=Medauroidea extradentata TaxID=614211 RepID=A0A191XT17_9NEOP|nr:glycoside hydrolase family 28 [Medauroidea extradentata]